MNDLSSKAKHIVLDVSRASPLSQALNESWKSEAQCFIESNAYKGGS